MPFARRRDPGKRATKRGDRGKDPFDHLASEREAAESGTPWFLEPDDGPELDVDAGMSSNLTADDLHLDG